MRVTTAVKTKITVGIAAAALTLGSLGPFAAPAYALAPTNPVGGDDPPSVGLNQEDEQNLAVLAKIQVQDFHASPSTVQPYQPTTLSWNVQLPSDPKASQITLVAAGKTVAPRGSLTATPGQGGSFGLTARLGRVSRALRTVQMQFDTSRCRTLKIGAGQVQGLVGSFFDSLPAEYADRLYDRNIQVHLSEQGVHLKLTGQISVNNWFDPDLTIDMVIGLRAVDGKLDVFFRKFDPDVDFPWYADTAPPIVSTIINHVISDGIEDGIKSELPKVIEQRLEEMGGDLAGGQKVWSVTTSADEVAITLCAPPPAPRTAVAVQQAIGRAPSAAVRP
jgi:hypothetical protein